MIERREEKTKAHGAEERGTRPQAAPEGWDRLAKGPRATAQRHWLMDRGWVNYGGAKGTFLHADYPDGLFTVTAAARLQEAGRPELPKRDAWVAPVDAPRAVGGPIEPLDPWLE